MATTTYSGALPPKKKAELAEIAEKLSLDSSGTKEEIYIRIKTHLDANDLSDNPVFSGLYPSKKRPGRKETVSSALVPTKSTEEEESPLKRKSSTRRKQTPPPVASDGALVPATLTAPPSPVRALIENVETAVTNVMPNKQSLVQVAERTGHNAYAKAFVVYESLRKFLSSATNIQGLTTSVEFLFIMLIITPWQWQELPLKKPGSDDSFSVPYVPLAFFLSAHLYKSVMWWSIPTLVLPSAAASLISFTSPPKDNDPLSAAIVRLALVATLDDSWFILQGKPVSQWRTVTAATNLAFAIAEAVEERRIVTRHA